MFNKEIHTGIEICSGTERVWEVLADLPSYQEWNPVITNASGELREGARLRLRFEPQGKRGHVFRPKLLAVVPNRELRWQGNPGVPGLFESQHCFVIEQKPDGKTRLDHSMIFYGLLVRLAGNRLDASTRGPFEQMNLALKNRAECEL